MLEKIEIWLGITSFIGCFAFLFGYCTYLGLRMLYVIFKN